MFGVLFLSGMSAFVLMDYVILVWGGADFDVGAGGFAAVVSWREWS